MSYSKKALIGCPPKYKTVQEMQDKIDEYFRVCEGTTVLKPDGTPLLDKYGQIVKDGKRPLTVSGLALFLGFTSRQALLNYQNKQAFVDTVTRAKLKIESYAEERLYDNNGNRGAIFNLKNNFRGWKENPIEDDTNVTEKLDHILNEIKNTANNDVNKDVE